MSHYLYLTINLLVISIPLIFSFEHRIKFFSKINSRLAALFMPAVLFCIWDYFFTKNGIWGFNNKYTLGLNFINLPLEEILFFICIPYSCIFTYEVIRYFSKDSEFKKLGRISSYTLLIISVIMCINFYGKAYTFSGFLLLILLISYEIFFNKNQFFGNFTFTYFFILIPFFIVNGILTGTGLDSPVVWYNNNENLGIRILTIPLEDIIYGFDLLYLNVLIYLSYESKSRSRLGSK